LKTYRKILGIFCTFFLVHLRVYALPLDFVSDTKNLQIKSIKQTVTSKNIIVFEGDVEVLIDHAMHIWADRVTVNRALRTLVVEKVSSGAIKIENQDFLILADTLELDLTNKTGHANNIRFHVKEGYISAGRAEKVGKNKWSLHHMTYTACAKDKPHWQIAARKAMVYGGYFIRVSGVLFKINKIPVFAVPKMAFPIQGRSKSGFLVPKIYLDYDSGFGFKEEYYWYLGQKCDTTLGVDWRRKKGVVFSDEFRWARSVGNYTFINSNYAIMRNTFMHRDEKILRATDQRYWISGKDFRSYDDVLLNGKVNCLARIDFGTDKNIGYQFFNSINDIDNTFYNSFIVRTIWPKTSDLMELRFDYTKLSRRRYSYVKEPDQEERYVKELDNSVFVSQVPHFESNSAYRIFKNNFFYRHDMFVDQIDYRESEHERLYSQQDAHLLLARDAQTVPLSFANLVRFNYRATCEEAFSFYRNYLRFFLCPNIQVRSSLIKDQVLRKNAFEQKLFARGGGRFFVHGGVHWALPEQATLWCFKKHSIMNYFQPVLSWDYIPKFDQSHWYHMDKWDRVYPKNQLELSVRNNFVWDNMSFDINISQAYDFYDQKDLFPLQRSVHKNTHLLPIHVTCELERPEFNILLDQEYDIADKRLLHSRITTGFSVGNLKFDMGYLFQHRKMQQVRELLSNTSHFILLDVSVPLGKNLTVRYDGQFYSETGRHFLELSNLKPLLHRVYCEYNGHCWGCYLGYEEKRYRELGNDKHERAIVFSLRLDSLGSFAKKFKRPTIFKDHE